MSKTEVKSKENIEEVKTDSEEEGSPLYYFYYLIDSCTYFI